MISNRRMFITILVCLLWPVTTQALNKDDVTELYRQGTGMFRQANDIASQKPRQAKELYAKAAMRFERIVREGNIENGKLYYNIGNTYFRMGDLGRAILNYRRAQRYIPSDSNLYENLVYARSRRYDKIEEEQQTKALKTLLFWHYDLSSRTRSIIFVVCFGLFWLGASIRLFSGKSPPRWSLACMGFMAAIFLGSLISEGTMEHRNRAGVVLAEEVIGRKGDSLAYQPSFKEAIHAGTEFKLVESRDNWYNIELNDGRCCWIPNKKAELLW